MVVFLALAWSVYTTPPFPGPSATARASGGRFIALTDALIEAVHRGVGISKAKASLKTLLMACSLPWIYIADRGALRPLVGKGRGPTAAPGAPSRLCPTELRASLCLLAPRT
jgi:hypothetical protein